MIRATGKVAHTLADALRNQPLALPIVIVNGLCLLVVGFVLYSVAERAEAHDKLLADVIQKCK